MSPCHAEDADVFTSFPTSSLGTGHWEAPLHHFLNEKNEAFPNRVWEREKTCMSPCHAEDADVFTSFPTSSLGTGHWEAPLYHFLNEKNEAFPNRVWEREEKHA